MVDISPEETGTTPRGRVPSFVMTLWLEPLSSPDEPEWRWRVTRVDTGKQCYFRRLGDLLSYVSAESGVAAPR
ncbi:MAG: hypothetical protein HW388_768 [Dehalococcoidia bacterium]|nr:hypothetical protein [Dehalococcoidia bacterium]